MCGAYTRMTPLMLFLLSPAGVPEWQKRRTNIKRKHGKQHIYRAFVRVRSAEQCNRVQRELRIFGAREWGRTITALRPPDFESGASASSATRARALEYHKNIPVEIGWRSRTWKSKKSPKFFKTRLPA